MTTAGSELPDLEAVLAKSRHENFPVAAWFLPTKARTHLMAIYGYARFVDDVGDETGAEPAAVLRMLDLIEADVTRLYEPSSGITRPLLPAIARLEPTVRACGIPPEPLLALVEANRLDQHKQRYETFEELRHYCTLSADPVGRLVLHVFAAATDERFVLSDRVCTGLQLVEHWQDVAEDRRRGRVYLPVEDRRRFGVSDDDLLADHAGPALRELLAFEVARAHEWLDLGAPLVGRLRGTARAAVAAFVAGGRANLNAITTAGYDVLPGAPKSSRWHIAAATLRTLTRGR